MQCTRVTDGVIHLVAASARSICAKCTRAELFENLAEKIRELLEHFSFASVEPPGHMLTKGDVMLEWILIFLAVAAVASLVGLPRLAGASATVAQVLIFVALAAMVVYLVVGLVAIA
jgi:uncharacterized membrane protein YtjA (UPF0391 family)